MFLMYSGLIAKLIRFISSGLESNHVLSFVICSAKESSGFLTAMWEYFSGPEEISAVPRSDVDEEGRDPGPDCKA